MKKINGLLLVLLAAVLLATVNTGCSAKAKQAYHLQKANRYFDAGKYDQAEVEYFNVLRNGGENALAIGRLGTIYFEQGRLQKAAPFLIKGVELAPNDLDLRIKLSGFYMAAGKPKVAATNADFVLARRPQDKEAPLLLVATSDSKKALEETRQRLQALSQKADTAALEIALGSIALNAKDLKTAESSFKRAQALDPKSSSAWSALATLYLVQSNLVATESALKTAAELAPDRSQEKIRQAEFKSQTGDPAAGRQMLQAMVEKTPDYIPAWIALVQMAATEKKYDECATLLGKVLARDPDNFQLLMASGQLKLSQGKTAEATAEFERLAKIYTQVPITHYQLAVTYLAGNETDKAITSLNRAVALNTNYSEAILLLDGLEIKRGNADAAMVSLKKMAQQYPKANDVQLLLAEGYRAQRNYAPALAIYHQLEATYPTNSQIPLLLGTTALEQKDTAAARKSFTRALQLAPDDFTALDQLVKLDLMEKQFATASQRVQAQLAKNPGRLELQVLQAQIFMAQGDKTNAQAALSKLVETHPDADIGHMLLARLYMDDKQNQKALAELKTATEKNPKNGDALLMTGLIYDGEKDYKAARDAYEKLLLLYPKSIAALNNLAYLYSEYLDDLNRAYELAKNARDLLPGDPSAADTLGWILCKRGQYPSALPLLQDSASQLPGESEVQFHLGWALYMTGQEGPARQALQRALASGKEFRGQDECRQCLAVLAVDPKTAGADTAGLLEKRVATLPGDAIAWLRLAAIYERNGAVDKAVSAYESALRTNTKNVPVLIHLAQLYSAKKNPQKALELAKSAYNFAPDNTQVSVILGCLAYETGDYKLSVSLLQEPARSQSSSPEVLFDFARAAYAMGQVPEAQAAARAALQSAPAFPGADEARRFLSLTAQATDAAAGAAQASQILKSDPDYVPALMVMALVSEQTNDVSAAIQLYRKILGIYPNFSPAQRNLAILFARNSLKDPQAYEFATKARTAFPDDLEVGKALGIILYSQADYPRAERVLNETATAKNTDPELYYYLGMTQYNLKKSADCKKNLQKAINLSLPAKFNPEAKRVLAELK